MVDLDGAYDLHVHSAPDLFPRIADHRQIVAHATARGFAGLVMKNHFEGTASRAQLDRGSRLVELLNTPALQDLPLAA